ncbi:DUF7146 domain-containing protein [Thalassospira lohafexi]|nr:toprim domain-containing protein [Thalassospira lohafexi]
MAATITRSKIKTNTDNVARNLRFGQDLNDVASEMEATALRLLGKPSHRTNTQMRYGNKGSMAINLSSGTWFCHESGEGGGVLDLVTRETGLVGRKAAEWLGIADPDWQPRDNSTVRVESEAEKAEKAKRRSIALDIWKASQRAENSPVEAYLKGRGLDCKIPLTIRFNPNCLHIASGAYKPAMISAITRWPDNEVIAVHRTYLEQNDKGGWIKARVNSAKMVLGAIDGGAIRMGPLAGETLALAEGVEDALALAEMTGGPVWSVISASNFATVKLPNEISGLIIGSDADKAGDKAAVKAHKAFSSRLTVKRWPLKKGTDCLDQLSDWQERVALMGIPPASVRRFDVLHEMLKKIGGQK